LILEGEAEVVADAGVIGPRLQDAAVKSFRLGRPARWWSMACCNAASSAAGRSRTLNYQERFRGDFSSIALVKSRARVVSALVFRFVADSVFSTELGKRL
jgi:hypothetical protein